MLTTNDKRIYKLALSLREEEEILIVKVNNMQLVGELVECQKSLQLLD